MFDDIRGMKKLSSPARAPGSERRPPRLSVVRARRSRSITIGAVTRRRRWRGRSENIQAAKPSLLQGDLSDRDEPRVVLEKAVQALGGLDVLVNNAGAIVRRTPFLEVDHDLIDQVFDLNVRSVVTMTQAAVPHLEKRASPAIVNVGSIAGANGGGPGSSMYASSKAFIHNLTRHLAQDLASRGIRVNAIAPGTIATPFHATTPTERMEAIE